MKANSIRNIRKLCFALVKDMFEKRGHIKMISHWNKDKVMIDESSQDFLLIRDEDYQNEDELRNLIKVFQGNTKSYKDFTLGEFECHKVFLLALMKVNGFESFYVSKKWDILFEEADYYSLPPEEEIIIDF